MLSISATDAWRVAHSGATIGLLEMTGIENSHVSPALNERKLEIEAHLREHYKGYTRQALLALPVMADYDQYYTRFNKTYHVQLQLESIVLKNKSLPTVSPAVDANFIAELETLVLTAGHDVTKLHEPVRIDVSREDDAMTQMNGATKPIRAGDMVMRDADGISCSILYGQDNRSPIAPETTHVLYVAYAPVGVPTEAVEHQLQLIQDYIHLFSPHVTVQQSRLLTARQETANAA